MGIDGSATSDRALQEAIALAGDQHATLRGIHVLEDTPAMAVGVADGLDLATLDDAIRQAGQAMLDQAAVTARASDVPVETALLSRGGDRIGDVLVADAREWQADLIVLGTHGRHGLAHLLLGSFAEAVVHRASVPVLLVRQP